MRYFISLFSGIILAHFYVITAYAQLTDESPENLIKLGNGLVLETVPATYETVYLPYPMPKDKLVVIPATFERITETVIIQDASNTIDIVPAIYGPAGEIDQAATATVKAIPAVTTEITRNVVKTPARIVSRKTPCICRGHNVRKLLSREIYIVKGLCGHELERYEDPAELAAFINSL